MSFQSTSELMGGGQIYHPPGTSFDGIADAYTASITTTGNVVRWVLRFRKDGFTGDTSDYAFIVTGANGRQRCGALFWSTDNTGTPESAGNIQLFAQNTAGTAICRLMIKPGLYDGQWHTIIFSFDATAGTVFCRVDGKDLNDYSHVNYLAPTTGTLESGAGTVFVARNTAGTAFLEAELSWFGVDDGAITSIDGYVSESGEPLPIDFSTWLCGHFAAYMEENEGTIGAFSAAGTPTVSDPGPASSRGLATIGDITARDVRQGKVGWANAQRIAGSLDHNGLLLFHQFDGAVSTPVSSLTPDFDYGGVGAFSESGSNNVYLDGTGHLVSNGGYLAWFNPQGGWPSRAGKTRCYRVWGKVISPLTTSYFPTLQINYVDGSNFWSCRSMFSSNVYTQMYEWIAGGVGEGVRQSTAVFSASGEYYFDMVVRDFGDTVSMTLTCVDESSKPSDLTVTQPQTIQLYKAARPNQATDQFTLGKWEVPSGWLNNLIRGIMVWDE